MKSERESGNEGKGRGEKLLSFGVQRVIRTHKSVDKVETNLFCFNYFATFIMVLGKSKLKSQQNFHIMSRPSVLA